MTPRAIQRGYRKFRRTNKDEYLTLFLFLDTAIWTIKHLVILACLFLLYQFVTARFFNGTEITQAPGAQALAQAATSAPETNAAPAADEPAQAPEPASVVAVAQEINSAAPQADELTQSLDASAQSAPQTPTLLVDAAWILNQDPRFYTIQFGTSPDLALLQRQAQSLQTDQDAALYPFKRTPSGRPVFGLSSGLYDSFEAAEQHLELLPQSLKTFQPWIRPLDDLQRQIRTMVQ